MTPQEKHTRALTAAKPHYPGWTIAEVEKSSSYLAVLEALNDLDKPIPDADEAWRPFLEAIDTTGYRDLALSPATRALIARVIAALPLIPEQYR